MHFKLSIADIVLDIRCCFSSTYDFCRKFQVPDACKSHDCVVISPDDIETELQLLHSRADAGVRIQGSTPQSLEILVLCRKIAEIMPRHGAIFFHGSALAFQGQGVLFTATSGTGKSTHSALWRKVYGDHVQMINDDKPFLKVSGDRILVCGSPWMGKHRLGNNVIVPLKSLCILNRGIENRIEPVISREAMPLLIQQTYRPQTAEALLHSMKILDEISRYSDIYRIYCNMDDQAARTVCSRIFLNCKEGIT